MFAELGGYMSEGLAVGINEKARLALSAAGRVSSMLPKALPAALAFSATMGAGTVMADTTGQVMSESFMSSPRGVMTVVHQNNTFHIHAAPGMDEKALADAVARKMDGVMRAQAARARGRLYDEV